MTDVYTMIIRPRDNSRGSYILPLSYIHSSIFCQTCNLSDRGMPHPSQKYGRGWILRQAQAQKIGSSSANITLRTI